MTEQDTIEFGRELDRIRKRVEAQIGDEDLQYIQRVDRFSKTMEVAGRSLIHFSLTPVGFFAGVGALWVHKQLQATEIGHTTLHGAFDKLPGAEAYQSKTFRWAIPIDEESWRYVHNVRHHQYTNIAGRDPDIHFGPIRWNEHTPYNEKAHAPQVRRMKMLMTHFAAGINLHVTGVADHLEGNGRPEKYDLMKEATPGSLRTSLRKAMRKFVPYYGKEFVLFPALAGPMFGKVVLGNLLTEMMRDAYSAATIFVGHVGDDVTDYEEGTKAGSRARWYVMQVEGSANFEVPLPVSILCGGLDRQIEHHLFPKFPTNRLREISPEVRALCEKHGVKYTTGSWRSRLKKAFDRARQLSQPDLAATSAPAPELQVAA
jgi:fatty acid desaturase